MLYVPEVLVRRANGGAAPVFAASGVNDPDLSARMSAAHAVMEGGASARAKMAALEHVIGVLCERHALRGAARERQLPRTRMVDVRRYLDAHFAERVRLADLAAIAHVGRFHLIRAFRAAYGIPPYAYLELARVTRARAMLRDGVRVSDVAFSTGFSDQSHLTRRFKRVFGVPPGRYARSYARARLDLRSA
jgi:AraC-like DNA-binding protein